jgi:hypothetical protein
LFLDVSSTGLGDRNDLQQGSLAIRKEFAEMLNETVFDAVLAGALRLDVRHACFNNWVYLFGPYR